jgi:predicted SAM-dependent methyltransferase
MRKEIASKYIHGRGLEIGAFHNPWPNVNNATILYIDKWDVADCIEKTGWKGSANQCVRPDIIGNGQTLEGIVDNRFDFVLGSHVLEHCISPLDALRNQTDKLKKGGVLIHAIPERTQTFDKDRPNSPLKCLIADYCGVVPNYYPHYEEYFKNVDKITDAEELEKIILDKIKQNIDVHFHAWDQHALKEMIDYACEEFNLGLELFKFIGHEVFVVMRKL